MNWLVGLWYTCVFQAFLLSLFCLNALLSWWLNQGILLCSHFSVLLFQTKDIMWAKMKFYIWRLLAITSEVRWGDLIVLFCLVRKKIPLISSKAYGCLLRRKDRKVSFAPFTPTPATSKPWALKVSAVSVWLSASSFLSQHPGIIGGQGFGHLLVSLPAVESAL